MTGRSRPGLFARAAAGTILALAATYLAVTPAAADVAAPYFASGGNASDPHITRCVNPSTGINGFCLYTSLDMGYGAYNGNSYPMLQTILYYSDNGYSNWQYRGIVASEEWINQSVGGWVPNGALHLWAPAAANVGADTYLYVPNVANNSVDPAPAPNIHNSSRINVWKYTGGILNGSRTNLGYINPQGYMSDPDILLDGSNRYLYWADGDGSTCGGLKSAQLNSDMFTINTASNVVINGVGVLGSCKPAGSNTGIGRPYLEGSSTYRFSAPGMPDRYTLIFAAKPTSIPLECQTAFTGGGANTTNEVIAYATSMSAQGPFEYQGIMMCGSTSEWTNQATVSYINGRWVIIYHDGPAKDVNGNPNRKPHAACLYAGNGQITGVYRAPADAAHSFDACMAGQNPSFVPLGVRSPGGNAVKTPLLVSAASASPHHANANRFLAGPNERWQWEWLGPFHYAIRSLKSGKLLCAPNGLATDELQAVCTTVNARSTFARSFEGDNFELSNDATGKYVTIKSNNRLKADGATAASGAKFVEYGN